MLTTIDHHQGASHPLFPFEDEEEEGMVDEYGAELGPKDFAADDGDGAYRCNRCNCTLKSHMATAVLPINTPILQRRCWPLRSWRQRRGSHHQSPQKSSATRRPSPWLLRCLLQHINHTNTSHTPPGARV